MSLLARRRALMSAKGKALSSEYQRVEYIQSTGTQYINTGFIQTVDDIKISCQFEYSTTSTKFKEFYGLKKDPIRCCLMFLYGRNMYFQHDATNSISIYLPYSTTSLNTCVVTAKNGISSMMLNEELKENVSYQYEALYETMTLFKSNVSEIIDGLKIYSFSIEQSGEVVRNFVPCYRKTDNVTGMYDLANNQFYTNEGTGEFILGGEVYVL